MAEVKISGLTDAQTITGAELLAVVQTNSGTTDTFKATVDDLKPALEDNLSTGAPSWTTDGVLRAGHDIIAGYVDSGASAEAGGTIALTLNDGNGNANIAFNHNQGIPDRSGSSARITSTVDSSQETLDFQLKGNVSAGNSTTLTSVLQLREDSITLLEATTLNEDGTEANQLVGKGYIDTQISAEASDRATNDAATLVSANQNTVTLVSNEEQARIAAVTTLTNDLTSLTTVVDGKIGETEIDANDFTFASNELSLNLIKEGKIETGAITRSKIKNHNISADKLIGTENIQQGDFLIYNSTTGGFEATDSTAANHKLFSPNHTDVASNVTPSYGDSMYYNGTEWTTGNFGNYGADMEYVSINGVDNATFTNLTFSGINSNDIRSYYDRYFTIPAGATFTQNASQINPQSGVFNPAIYDLPEEFKASGVNNSNYDESLNNTSRVGFGSWWNAYGLDDGDHALEGSIQFPIAGFTGGGLVNQNIRGLFIRVHNWLSSSSSLRKSRLFVQYPDGSKKPLLEYERKVAEGGSVHSDINQVVFVPVNEGQTQIEVDFLLDRGGSGEGIEFEIIGAHCTKRVELSPEIDIIQIIGSQDSALRDNGFVDGTSITFQNDPSVWTSEAPTTTGATDWSGVFPIEIPNNVSKSVITVVNNWHYDSSTPGGQEEIDHITITVDWNANTIFGTYTWGSEYEETGFLYSTDLVGEKTFTVEQIAGTHAFTPTIIKFELNGRSIVKLPAPSHGGAGAPVEYANTGQKYTIENYKTNAISTYKSYDNSFGFFFDPDNAQTYSTFFGSSYISKDGSFIFSGGESRYKLNGVSPATLPEYTRVQIPLQTGEKVIEYYYGGAGIEGLQSYVSVFVLTNRGRVFGAGYGGTGGLGQGNLEDQSSFQLILEDVAWLGVGNGHSHYLHCIAIKNDGTAYSWGNNGAGELGRGAATAYTATSNLTPTLIPGFGPAGANGRAVKAFALNSNIYGKSFIITEDRKVWSCGSAYNGGIGHTTNKTAFADTGLVGDYVVANSADSNKSVYLVDGADLYASGDNTYGQLGLGNTTTPSNTFQQVTLTSGVSQIATTGTNASTAVLGTDGSISVFGFNSVGELGTGNTTSQNTPVVRADLGTNNKKVKLFGNDNYAAAYVLKTDGTVFVAGYNNYGQLGTGNTTNLNTFTKMAKEDRVYITDFQLFGYNYANAFVGVDQDDNLWGVGQNSTYRMLSTVNGVGIDRSLLTQIDPVNQTASSGPSAITELGGSAPYYGCRAFAYYNGKTNVLHRAGNISSVVRENTGRYRFYFDQPMIDGLYTIQVSGSGDGVTETAWNNILIPDSATTTDFRIVVKGSGPSGGITNQYVYVAVFG